MLLIFSFTVEIFQNVERRTCAFEKLFGEEMTNLIITLFGVVIGITGIILGGNGATDHNIIGAGLGFIITIIGMTVCMIGGAGSS